MGGWGDKLDFLRLKISKCIIAKSILKKNRKPDGYYIEASHLFSFSYFIQLKLLLNSGYMLSM